MDLDEAIFREAQAGRLSLPVLRVYGFCEPAVTCGYSQQELPAAAVRGMKVFRRITGGGVVFHGTDFTYSVTASLSLRREFESLDGSYRIFHEVVRNGFKAMGIGVDLFEGRSARGLGTMCFSSPVRHDLLYRGKKIAGAAQKRSKDFFLQQGTVELGPFIGDVVPYEQFRAGFKEEFLRSFKSCFDAEYVFQAKDLFLKTVSGKRGG